MIDQSIKCKEMLPEILTLVHFACLQLSVKSRIAKAISFCEVLLESLVSALALHCMNDVQECSGI